MPYPIHTHSRPENAILSSRDSWLLASLTINNNDNLIDMLKTLWGGSYGARLPSPSSLIQNPKRWTMASWICND